MAFGISFRVERDDVSPAISGMIKRAQNKTAVLRAMGNAFKSITEGNFSGGTQYRPIPWKPKSDGSVSRLMKSNALSRSFHLAIGTETATLSNPMPYAGVHQFGATIRAKPGKALKFTVGGVTFYRKKVVIPARPFFPVLDGKLTAPAESLIVRAGERAMLREH